MKKDDFGTTATEDPSVVAAAAAWPRKEQHASVEKKRGKKLKGASTAYNIYVAEHRAQITMSEPELSFGDISKRVSQNWRNLPEEERRPYEIAAQRDKERYEREKAAYPQEGELDQTTKRRKRKDANTPKKNLNAWMFFIQDVRAQVVAELGEDGKRVAAVTKAVGQRWAKMSSEEKAPYELMAAEDRKRYLRDMENYIASQAGGATRQTIRDATVQG